MAVRVCQLLLSLDFSGYQQAHMISSTSSQPVNQSAQGLIQIYILIITLFLSPDYSFSQSLWYIPQLTICSKKRKDDVAIMQREEPIRQSNPEKTPNQENLFFIIAVSLCVKCMYSFIHDKFMTILNAWQSYESVTDGCISGHNSHHQTSKDGCVIAGFGV